MHFPTDRTAHTTAFDGPVVDHWLEQKIAQAAESIRHAVGSKPLQQSALPPELRSATPCEVMASRLFMYRVYV